MFSNICFLSSPLFFFQLSSFVSHFLLRPILWPYHHFLYCLFNIIAWCKLFFCLVLVLYINKEIQFRFNTNQFNAEKLHIISRVRTLWFWCSVHNIKQKCLRKIFCGHQNKRMTKLNLLSRSLRKRPQDLHLQPEWSRVTHWLKGCSGSCAALRAWL